MSHGDVLEWWLGLDDPDAAAVDRVDRPCGVGGRAPDAALGWSPRRHGPRKTPRERPEEILDRRFASGEIDADTYSEARKRLAAHRPGPGDRG